MSATGDWNLTIKTPMGLQKMRARFIAEGESLTGTMHDAVQPSTAIKEGYVKQDAVGWKFDLRKPLPMTLTFTATIHGDSLTGTARAGFFATAAVSGTRVIGPGGP